MDGLLEVRNISVSIQRPPRDVYAFITNGDNVPRWAAGLGTTLILLSAPAAEGYYPRIGMTQHRSCWITPRAKGGGT